MQDDIRRLIEALADDDEFRQRFLDAPDRAARLRAVREKGLAVPTEEEVAGHLGSAGIGDGKPVAPEARSSYYIMLGLMD